jgi:predicted O-methyltransferase YrrM
MNLLYPIVCSLLFSSVLADLPEPYNRLETLMPFNDHGWYGNKSQIEKILKLTGAEVVIELGVWMGSSTRHIASVIPDNGIVYAVDHWLGSEEHHQNHVEHFLPTLYEQFLSNVIHAKLTHKITPLKMTTLEAAAFLKKKGIQPDLVYVDAAHDEKSVYEDIATYFPLIKGHGKICGDDWGWGGDHDPIKKAVTQFANENDLSIEVSGGFWILHEHCVGQFLN